MSDSTAVENPSVNADSLWDNFAQQEEKKYSSSTEDPWEVFSKTEEKKYKNNALTLTANILKEAINPIPAVKELTESQRGIIQGRPLWNTVKSFGQGWGKTMEELAPLDPGTVATLSDMKILDGYMEGEQISNNAFVDGVVLPSAQKVYGLAHRTITLPALQALNVPWTAVTGALAEGGKAAADQIGEELGNQDAAEFLKESPELAVLSIGAAAVSPELTAIILGVGALHKGFMRPPLPRPVALAKANRILESEAEYFGLKEPTPQQAKNINQAAEMYPHVEKVTPENPTVHEVAREIAPEVFSKYDSLHKERDLYRGILYVFGEAKRAEAPNLSPFPQQISALEVKIENASARNAKRYREQVADLQKQHEEWVDDHIRTDSPEMKQVREEIQKVDYEMRDMAVDVSSAYREAEKRVPSEPEVIEVAKETEEVSPAQQVEGATKEPQVAVSLKSVEDQKADIIKDVKKQMIAAGRSEEEAELSAQLIASHYEARSQRFEGKHGTPEEMYLRDSPEIKAGKTRPSTRELKQTARELQQKARGKIRLATDKAKAVITLFDQANASTLIHETGHHWLDELVKDAEHNMAPVQLKADVEVVRKWLGNDGKEITGRQHEKFARGFERFLMEGVAPSRALDRVFSKFKEWLTSLYSTVDKLKSPINDDIRHVFDRLLSANPEKTVIAPEMERYIRPSSVPSAGAVIAAPESPVFSVPEQAPISQAGKETEIAPAKGKQDTSPEGPSTPLGKPESQFVDKAGNIRLDNLNTPEDINTVLRQTAKDNDDFIGARRGVLTDAQVHDLAGSLGLTVEQLDLRKVGQAFNAEEVVAARKLLIQSATDVRDFMNKAAHGTDEDVMAYAEAKARHMMIQEHVSGVTAEAGRALRAFRNLEGAAEAKALGEFLEQTTGKTLFQLKEEAALGAKLETPQQVSKFLQDSKKAKFSDMLIEFWINALLSGPQTHIKNMLGNVATALWSVPETAAAAGVGKIRNMISGSEERVVLGEAQSRLFGMVQGARDGIVVAGKAFKDEDFISGGRTVEQLRPKAIPSVKVEVLGKEMELGGKQVRIPGRLLGAEDEFFKAIAYRQEINAIAYRAAWKEGLRGDAFNQRMAELVMNPTEAMMEKAKAFTEYQTYTNRLGEFGSTLQKLANSKIYGLPIPKFIIPFVRTPANILKYAGERTPLGMASKEVRDNVMGRNGKIAQDTQIARILVGTSISLATISLALQGNITGGGPADPKAKAMWRLAGNQPYSVNVGGTWYSFAWLEPFATVMGISADMVEISKADTGKIEDNEYMEMAGLLFDSVSKNLMSKLSLRGAADLINAVTDRERWGKGYLQNLAGTAVPSILAQTARATDPTMRQARTTVDALKARIPGLRSTLFPVRDVWGEPIVREGALGPDLISPVYETRLNNDPVNKLLLKINKFPSKADRKIRGVELTDQQYDDFVRISGRQMKMRLDSVVRLPGFENVPADIQTRLITKIIDSSRENARGVIMMKNPSIPKQALDNKRRAIKR